MDSALVRQLVNEVLTETVVLMLGQRDALDTGSEPRLEPTAAHQEVRNLKLQRNSSVCVLTVNQILLFQENRVSLVPTPVPTPPPSPTITINRTTPPTTPPTSEPTSLLIEECPQPITATGRNNISIISIVSISGRSSNIMLALLALPAYCLMMVLPTTEIKVTPTPTPEPAPSAGSPPPLHQAPPLGTWLDAELPLDEERPEEHLETEQQLLLV